MKQGKYQKKIYSTFLTVFTILILLFTIIFFTVALERSEIEKEAAIVQGIKTNVSNSQLKFEIISNAIESVANSEEVDLWDQSDSLAEYYFSIIGVQNELRLAVSRVTNVPFELATTYYDEDSIVITPFASMEKDSYFYEELGLSEQQVSKIYEELEYSHKPMVFSFERGHEGKEIAYLIKTKYSEHDILYIMTVGYEQLIDESEDYEWYLINDQGIFASDGEADKALLYDAFSRNSLEHKFEFDKKTVFPQTIANAKWSILYVYDMNQNNVSVILLYFVLPLLALTLFVLILSGYITKRLYGPMKEVMADFAEGGEVVVDEFEVIKKNSNIIKTLSGQLKSALNERNTLLSQRFSRELLFGITLNRLKYPEEWLLERSYCVAVIELIPDSTEGEDEHLYLYKNEFISYTQEETRLRYVSLNYYTYAIIIETAEQKEAMTMINAMIEGIDIDDEQDMRIALSNSRSGFNGIPECFDESRKILEYKYLYHQRTIMTVDQISHMNQTSYYFPLRTENKMIHSILSGDEQALSIYDELMIHNEINTSLEPEVFKNLIFALIGTVGRVIQELKVESTDFLGEYRDYPKLSQRWGDESIVRLIREVIEKTLKYVCDKKENSESRLASQMLAYIHSNYTDDIMLIDLAEELNVSEKYCGILFKKAVGENYKNYLNTYRIEQSKEIIYKDQDVKVADLAKWVGFNSSNTFIRVFTKHTGMTPKRYAEEYVKNRKLKR